MNSSNAFGNLWSTAGSEKSSINGDINNYNGGRCCSESSSEPRTVKQEVNENIDKIPSPSHGSSLTPLNKSPAVVPITQQTM